MWETKVRRQGSSGKWERSRETTFFHLSFVSCKGDNEAAASEETNGETSGETNGASWETRQQGQRWTKMPVNHPVLEKSEPLQLSTFSYLGKNTSNIVYITCSRIAIRLMAIAITVYRLEAIATRNKRLKTLVNMFCRNAGSLHAVQDHDSLEPQRNSQSADTVKSPTKIGDDKQ